MEINKKAPDFKLFNTDNKEISLKHHLGKWVVLYFYPKDNTSGCTREAVDFSKLNSDFSKENAIILGISPDSLKSHANFINKHSLTIELLSDLICSVVEIYVECHNNLLCGKEYIRSFRATYLINPDG